MIEGNPWEEGLMDDMEARDRSGDPADFEQKQCGSCGGPVDEYKRCKNVCTPLVDDEDLSTGFDIVAPV